MDTQESSDPLTTARRYLEALAHKDRAALESLLSHEIVHEELPNRLNPRGLVADRAAMLKAFDRGKKLMASERYEIERSVVQGQTVALEVAWTATLAVAVGTLSAGDTMRAHFAMFLDVRAGQIARQRNYDCFDEF